MTSTSGFDPVSISLDDEDFDLGDVDLAHPTNLASPSKSTATTAVPSATLATPKPLPTIKQPTPITSPSQRSPTTPSTTSTTLTTTITPPPTSPSPLPSTAPVSPPTTAAAAASLAPIAESADDTGAAAVSAVPKSHGRKSSLLGLKSHNTLTDLSALGIDSPTDYMLLFRTVLTLQKKCRAWRARIKEKIRTKLTIEKDRQERELQQKILNKRKQQQEQPSVSAVPEAEGAVPQQPQPLVPQFKVDLPSDAKELLRFSLCMMKIQRKFRQKLAKARQVLIERLKKEREAQEATMREKMQKGRRKKTTATTDSSSNSTAPTETPSPQPTARPTLIPTSPMTLDLTKVKATTEGQQGVSITASGANNAAAAAPEEEDDGVLRGSLTSRLRKERQKRKDDRMARLLLEAEEQLRRTHPSTSAPSPSPSTTKVDQQTQAAADEVKESAVIQGLEALQLFIPIASSLPLPLTGPTDEAPIGTKSVGGAGARTGMSLPYISDNLLRDQHLQVMAVLTSLGGSEGVAAVERQSLFPASPWLSESGSSSACPASIFVTSCRVCPAQYLTAPLYNRVFGGVSRGQRGVEGESGRMVDGIADDDWEELINLPMLTTGSYRSRPSQ